MTRSEKELDVRSVGPLGGELADVVAAWDRGSGRHRTGQRMRSDPDAACIECSIALTSDRVNIFRSVRWLPSWRRLSDGRLALDSQSEYLKGLDVESETVW